MIGLLSIYTPFANILRRGFVSNQILLCMCSDYWRKLASKKNQTWTHSLMVTNVAPVCLCEAEKYGLIYLFLLKTHASGSFLAFVANNVDLSLPVFLENTNKQNKVN